jgi:hypothetical protein
LRLRTVAHIDEALVLAAGLKVLHHRESAIGLFLSMALIAKNDPKSINM